MPRPPASAESQFHLSSEDFRRPEVVARQRRKFVPRADDLASRLTPGDRVLDVGCAYGFFAGLLRERGLVTYGVDLAPAVLRNAEGSGEGLLASTASVEAGLPFRGASFDAVTAFDVIEHLHAPWDALDELRRVLRPGGLLFLSTPKGDAAYALRRVPLLGVPDPNPGHIHVRPPAYWDALLDRAGLEVEARWFSDWLSHVRGAGAVGRLAELVGLHPAKLPGLGFLSGTYLVIARKPRAA